MTFTYTDLSTDAQKVRLLVPDRVEATAVFSDEEIAAFLALEGGVYRAAALALETIAADTAMTLRVTETLGLKVDGARASDALLKRAAELRKRADEAGSQDGALWDIAELVVDPFSYRERLGAELLRGGA